MRSKLPIHPAFAVVTLAMLMPVSAEARDVSRSTRQFGDIAYREVILSRSKDEPAFVGIADTQIILSLDIPVPVGTLTVRDSGKGMTIGLGDMRCRTFTGIDGYRDLSIAEVGHRLAQLRVGCNWSDAAIANTMAVIEGKAGDWRNALAYMRQRAIVLEGSDLRCDPATPPPSPHNGPPVIVQNLDGGPLAPCGSATPTITTKDDPK
jgi:hypothetical protein